MAVSSRLAPATRSNSCPPALGQDANSDGAPLSCLRKPELSAPDERGGWHDRHCAIGVLDEVVRDAAEEGGLGAAASARPHDDYLGVDRARHFEHGSRDASVALHDKRIGRYAGRPQASRAFLGSSLSPLTQSDVGFRGIAGPGVTSEIRADHHARVGWLRLAQAIAHAAFRAGTSSFGSGRTSSALVGSVCGWLFSSRRILADVV